MVPAPMGFLERQRRLALWSEYAIANSVAIPPITRYHKVIRQHILPGLPVGLLSSKESCIALVISQLRKHFPPSVQKQSVVKVVQGEGDHLNNCTSAFHRLCKFLCVMMTTCKHEFLKV